MEDDSTESSEMSSKFVEKDPISIANIERNASQQFGKSRTFPQSRAELQASLTDQYIAENECPPYGSKSVVGRRAKMEDTCTAIPNLIQIPISCDAEEILPPRIALQLRGSRVSDRTSESLSKWNGNTVICKNNEKNEIKDISENSRTTVTCIKRHQSIQMTDVKFPEPVDTSFNAMETLHFFGVFDGHGGSDAAVHCAKALHNHIKNVLTSNQSCPSGESMLEDEISPGGNDRCDNSMNSDNLCQSNRPVFMQNNKDCNSNSSSGDVLTFDDMREIGSVESLAFRDMGELSPSGQELNKPSSLSSDESSPDELCPLTAETIEAALTKAFHMTDEEFGSLGGYENLALVGTTAVAALVGTRMISVANCGDSRAILCRNGVALPLTDDHKAAREDETARVEAAGGQILFWNGVRVMGLLAVSRAIGDHSLRPYVIPEPEVTVLRRNAADEMLIIATDGLWDVMSNQEACTLAKKCLIRARQRGSSRQNAARVAATVLTRAAVDRGSRDNVTVVIVDLTSTQDGKCDTDVGPGLLHQCDSLPININLHSSLKSDASMLVETEKGKATRCNCLHEEEARDDPESRNKSGKLSSETIPDHVTHQPISLPISPFEVPPSQGVDDTTEDDYGNLGTESKSQEEDTRTRVMPELVSPFS